MIEPNLSYPACSMDESNPDNRPTKQRFLKLPFPRFFHVVVAFSAAGQLPRVPRAMDEPSDRSYLIYNLSVVFDDTVIDRNEIHEPKE